MKPRKKKRKTWPPNHNFRKAREAAGLDGVELAALMDVTPGLISQIEGGKTQLTQETLAKAMRALKKPAEALLPDYTLNSRHGTNTVTDPLEGLSDDDKAKAQDYIELLKTRRR